jgi:pimeloyl-ACP methyl ester carboxylesterase
MELIVGFADWHRVGSMIQANRSADMDTLAWSPGHLNEPLEGDITLDWQVRGSSDSGLLFLPGWCESRAVFAPLIERLQPRWTTLSADLPGHGAAPIPLGDFGFDEIVAAAIEAIEHSGLKRVIPITHSHSGWAAIELRRRLGVRIPRLIFLDWLVLDPPPAFVSALRTLQDPEQWRDTCDQLCALWLDSSPPFAVTRHVVKDMGVYDGSMWARAAREIERVYRASGNPLTALAALEPSVPTAHIYAQPRDEGYLQAQREFARRHAWFTVQRVEAKTHFPTLEAPEEIANAIREFIRVTAQAAWLE